MASQKIYITIGGRRYPVIVEDDEELKAISDVEKSINKKINEYIRTYNNLDNIDVLALVLIDCSYDLLKSKKDAGDEERLIKQLDDINKILDRELSD